LGKKIGTATAAQQRHELSTPLRDLKRKKGKVARRESGVPNRPIKGERLKAEKVLGLAGGGGMGGGRHAGCEIRVKVQNQPRRRRGRRPIKISVLAIEL